MQQLLLVRWINLLAVAAGCTAVFGHIVPELGFFVIAYSECGKVAPPLAKVIAVGAILLYGAAVLVFALITPVLFLLRCKYKVRQGHLPYVWMALALVGGMETLSIVMKKREQAYIGVIIAGDVAAFRKMAPGLTPDTRRDSLWLAARWGRLEMVRLLLDSGADPNARLGGSGSTVLDAARENLGNLPDENRAVVEFLFAHGAKGSN